MRDKIQQEVYVNWFYKSYVETLLWLGPLLDTVGGMLPVYDAHDESDIEESALKEIRKECEDFLTAHDDDPVTIFLLGLTKEELVTAGQDFALTRNWEGAGFWDGDWDKPKFDEDWGYRLTERAKAYGEQQLYIGDDDKLYI